MVDNKSKTPASELANIRDRIHEIKNDIVGVQLNLGKDISNIDKNVALLLERSHNQAQSLTEYKNRIEKLEGQTTVSWLKSWPFIFAFIAMIAGFGGEEYLLRMMK